MACDVSPVAMFLYYYYYYWLGVPPDGQGNTLENGQVEDVEDVVVRS